MVRNFKLQTEIRTNFWEKLEIKVAKIRFRDRIFCLIRKRNHTKIENGAISLFVTSYKKILMIEGISTWRHHQIKWRTFLKMSEPSREYHAGRSRQAHWTDTEWTHLKRFNEQIHWTNTANRHKTRTEKMDKKQWMDSVDRHSRQK